MRGLAGLLLIAFALLLAAVLGAATGRAHEQWWNGKEVDPATKRLCCGDNDVFHLARAQIEVTAQGYLLKDTGETIPFSRAQPSPDGEFWAFRYGSPMQTVCFFAPIPSF